MFVPQQMVAFPWIASRGIVAAKDVFPAYYPFFEEAVDTVGEQPFLNVQETLAQRLEFARANHVSDVVLDPMYYGKMKPVLDRWPEHFQLIFDDATTAWAIYKVV